MVPTLIHVINISSNTLSTHRRLHPQHACQVIQQLNVAVVIIRLSLEHLQTSLPDTAIELYVIDECTCD